MITHNYFLASIDLQSKRQNNTLFVDTAYAGEVPTTARWKAERKLKGIGMASSDSQVRLQRPDLHEIEGENRRSLPTCPDATLALRYAASEGPLLMGVVQQRMMKFSILLFKSRVVEAAWESTIEISLVCAGITHVSMVLLSSGSKHPDWHGRHLPVPTSQDLPFIRI